MGKVIKMHKSDLKKMTYWTCLIEDEDLKQVATPAGTWALLSRWITPADATLWRQATYRFHALVADG